MTKAGNIEPRRRWRVWRFVCAASLAAAAGLVAMTWSTRAYQGGPGAPFPRYVALREGNVLFLSTIWRRSSATGNAFAWQTDGMWIYDRFGERCGAWMPSYARYGAAYFGTPGYVAWIDAICIPLWWCGAPALVVAGIAWREMAASRRAMQGTCVACGYSRAGLPSSSTRCPECGAGGGGGEAKS